ncbi:E3 ubiquitin-protein ligase WAV3-like [Nymphaea colorata]|nr:E3 ubiquitin-protein ligase WAV3-like [Nymphaea colorata]
MIGGCNLKQAAKKLALSCISVSSRKEESQDTVLPIEAKNSGGQEIENDAEGNLDGLLQDEEASGSIKNCAICLEPLLSGQQAIFTAQCSHAFHFLCISSNVQHGSTTCPICRAQWSYLPRQLGPKFPLPLHENDPILRILDDSIATFRVHRRSSHRSARYDDDDPVEPDPVSDHPRLNLNLIPIPSQPLPPPDFSPRRVMPLSSPRDSANNPRCLQLLPVEELTPHQPATPVFGTSPSGLKPCQYTNKAYLSVRLTVAPAMDIVLVASSNGAQLRLLKQSMALVVCSLRPVDRLAIVSCSSTATRAFPLRCMSAQGKRAALQVIDRLFCVGDADQAEGLRKGVKILEDRAHHNQHARIVLLSDGPADAFSVPETQFQVPILHFNFRFGFGYNSIDTCIKHEFEEFLAGLLGEVIRETQLRIGEKGMMVWLGELRGGEERRILVDLGECGLLSVGYSYVEGVEGEDCFRTGEVMVRVGETSDRNFSRRDMSTGGRWSSVERWDYHDPCMARRWAKRLHGLL